MIIDSNIESSAQAFENALKFVPESEVRTRQILEDIIKQQVKHPQADHMVPFTDEIDMVVYG